jgi:pimeloyl-ACP methyl ester carboxylesterase
MKRGNWTHTVFLFSLPCVIFAQQGAHYERNKGNPRAIVFVHGIFGNANDTWTAQNGAYWPRLVRDDPKEFLDADVYVAQYETFALGSRNTVPGMAQGLEATLRAVFASHRDVAFVCHSLGGLVVEQMLLANPQYAKQVSFIYFFGTPHAGAFVANFAAVFSHDPLLKAMFRGDGNNYLESLSAIWQGDRFNVNRYCAYETKAVVPRKWYLPQFVSNLSGVLIVDHTSATYGCIGTQPVGIPADHITMVKPEKRDALAYILLVNAHRYTPTRQPPPHLSMAASAAQHPAQSEFCSPLSITDDQGVCGECAVPVYFIATGAGDLTHVSCPHMKPEAAVDVTFFARTVVNNRIDNQYLAQISVKTENTPAIDRAPSAELRDGASSAPTGDLRSSIVTVVPRTEGLWGSAGTVGATVSLDSCSTKGGATNCDVNGRVVFKTRP